MLCLPGMRLRVNTLKGPIFSSTSPGGYIWTSIVHNKNTKNVSTDSIYFLALFLEQITRLFLKVLEGFSL